MGEEMIPDPGAMRERCERVDRLRVRQRRHAPAFRDLRERQIGTGVAHGVDALTASEFVANRPQTLVEPGASLHRDLRDGSDAAADTNQRSRGATPSRHHAGQLALAFKHYQRALQLNPRHRGAHEYVGEAYLIVKDLAKAEEHLNALRGICLIPCEESTDLEKAIAAYRQHLVPR